MITIKTTGNFNPNKIKSDLAKKISKIKVLCKKCNKGFVFLQEGQRCQFCNTSIQIKYQ